MKRSISVVAVALAAFGLSMMVPTMRWTAMADDATEAEKSDDPMMRVIEAMVRRQFDEQLERHAQRIVDAEARLAEVRARFDDRKANADRIIAEQVASIASRAGVHKEVKTEAPTEPIPVSVLAAEGWQAWRERDYRVALPKFESALAQEPDNAIVLNGLGWTLLHLGEHERSNETFRRLLEIDSTHGAALNGIGQNLVAMGQLDEAEQALVKATEAVIDAYGEKRVVRNQMTASWTSLVRLLVDEGKTESAITWAERYLKHAPDDQMMRRLLEDAKGPDSIE
ncbi:MAG: tetratricopeptide repeat protein [Planctomycetota bacterium]